jgi:hypothetical protein
MSITLANAWSANYAKLAAASTYDDKLPGKYSLVLPPTTIATTCCDSFLSLPDCKFILISPSGRVQLLHHAHWDKPSLVYTDRSNNLWTVLGVGDSPLWPPLTTAHKPLLSNFDYCTRATIVKAKAPFGR